MDEMNTNQEQEELLMKIKIHKQLAALEKRASNYGIATGIVKTSMFYQIVLIIVLAINAILAKKLFGFNILSFIMLALTIYFIVNVTVLIKFEDTIIKWIGEDMTIRK